MNLGRPKEFDRRHALERAMDVFWANGYEATSVQDLLDAMRINRGSMYDTFGDKRALFMEAVDHYGETVLTKWLGVLDGPGSPLGNIHRFLKGFEKRAADGECRGCLVSNTAVELAPHDPVVAGSIQSHLQRIERCLRRALDRAVDAGQLPPRTETRSRARFLMATAQGLALLSKASAGRAVINDTIAVAMSALR